jgi:hypothetical protein
MEVAALDSHKDQDQFMLYANELIKIREMIANRQPLDTELASVVLHEAADMLTMISRCRAAPSG